MNKSADINFRAEKNPLASLSNANIEKMTYALLRQAKKQEFARTVATAREVLKIVGLGAFLAGSLIMPNLPKLLRPYLNETNDPRPWRWFNIPYLKRTLARLEKQKLVEFDKEGNKQIVKITDQGKQKILRYALEEISVSKPSSWDGYWRLVSYDVPKELEEERNTLRRFLLTWGFYPFHESVFLHAYPCEEQVEFLREYLGIGQYVRFLTVSKIENDQPFRDYFDLT